MTLTTFWWFDFLASFKGINLHIKQLRLASISLKAKMIDHLRTLREIRHENLNPFIGCYLDADSFSVVYEQCSRGSLRVILNFFSSQFVLDGFSKWIHNPWLGIQVVINYGSNSSEFCSIMITITLGYGAFTQECHRNSWLFEFGNLCDWQPMDA